jgi:tetratricopeptide (TPR) repeat protein
MTMCSLQRTGARLVASSAALCALLAAPGIHAQAQDQAAARALFEDGRRLLKDGKYEQACRTLEAASKLYSSPGILLNLGDCYEKLGRTASAWTEFGEAAAVAARSRRSDQVSEAKRRQAAIEPKLTRLTIHVTTAVTGLEVTRDQTDIASAAWGDAIPVDPGTHDVHAQAQGYEPWSTSIVVSTPGQTVTVEVPLLTASPTPPPAPPGHEAETNPNTTSGVAFMGTPPPAPPPSRVVDWVLVGSGLAVGAAGGVLWGLGASHASGASHYDSKTENYQTALSDYNSAKTLYYVGLTGAAVGAATASVGLILLVSGRGGAHRTEMGAVQALPWISTSGGGMQVAGGF